MTDPLLLGPAALFAASTAYTTAVAATEPDRPGEPFGLRVPGRVRTHLVIGLGSAISAPWPMPAIAMWAAVRGSPGSAWAARTTTLVGIGILAGILSEPATWGRRPSRPMDRVNVPLGLATGAAMTAAGTYRLRRQVKAPSVH
jgi:hypothetical protein